MRARLGVYIYDRVTFHLHKVVLISCESSSESSVTERYYTTAPYLLPARFAPFLTDNRFTCTVHIPTFDIIRYPTPPPPTAILN